MTVFDKQNKSKNIESIYFLSPLQEGILFHTLYAPKSGVYFEQFCYTLHGNLNVLAFEQAWQRVLERHPILRTLFVWENRKKPLQVVRKQVDLPWSNHDWRSRSVFEGESLSPIEQEARLKAFLQADRDKGIELDKAPLMRFSLIQVADDTYQFVWSYHHLLMDGWSFPIILKEVFAFYEAFHKGQQIYLSPARPYRDYITWLQQQDRSQAERFWQQALQGFSAPTPLVVDRALAHNSHPQQTHNLQERVLSAPATAALQSFARQHHLTLNTLVQGAWALLLSRYSGESDVVFGATVSGRPTALSGVESMVGLFINTLPVRVQVCEQMELLPWLMQLQAQQVEREQYSYSSLLEIQHNSELPQGMPLFESIVVFENYPVDASLQAPNDTLDISDIRTFERTNYPLTLVAGLKEGLSVRISYDSCRFEVATITRMLGHFQTLLQGIGYNPLQRISDVPLLTAAERHQLLVEWNDSQTEYPESQCLHQLFEAQVEQTPEAVAVVFEDQQLTYRELNARANQLAHHLQAMGVRPEVLVGICVERSIEMVIGLLGILKAGGAYVPLDPAYPKERLAFMIEDTQAPILLTQQQLVEKLPEHQARVVYLDNDWEAIERECEDKPAKVVTPDNLAYVIYTSGSTGKPKGVLVNHHNVVRLFAATQSWFHFNERDVWTLFHSYAFDLSVWEIWGAFLYGGRLVVVPYGISRAPDALYDLLYTKQVTVLNQTPSAFRQLIRVEEEASNSAREMALRLVIFAGEALELRSLQPWFERHGDHTTQLVNMYGITETTVHVTYRLLTMADLSANASVVGRPMPDLQVYLLDQHWQPVPIGVPGEMYIGGAGVTCGYLNRPELTVERFVSNPFKNQLGSRLYKSGDLARYLPDGDIEYLGRIDHQVKIRGFRIELGEVEAVLAKHPKVREMLVLAREDQPGNKCLVAYVVPKQEQRATASELSRFLKEQLPDYMVPSAFVMLDSLPLTTNGKIDRRALPAPNTSSFIQEASFVPPRDSLEQQLAQIWSEVLDVYPVGVRDSFFDLGGHSLLALPLMAQIQRQFGKDLPLAILFQGPTIEHLATILRKHSDSSFWSPLVAIQSGGSKRPFFCVPGGGGNVIYFYDLARYLGPDQPFYGLQALGLDGESKPHTRVEDMASYYIEALQAFQPQGPYLLGGHSFGSKVAFEMAQQLLHQGHEVALLAILDTNAPISGNKPAGVDWDDARWMTEIASIVERLFGKNLEVSYDVLQSLDPDEQLNYLKERLKMVNVLPPDAQTTQVRGLVQVFKANTQTHYVPQEVHQARITLFRASEIHSQNADSDELSEILSGEPTWGWDKFSVEPVEIHVVPGNHITMMTKPHVQVLAEHLKACIEQAQADKRG